LGGYHSAHPGKPPLSLDPPRAEALLRNRGATRPRHGGTNLGPGQRATGRAVLLGPGHAQALRREGPVHDGRPGRPDHAPRGNRQRPGNRDRGLPHLPPGQVLGNRTGRPLQGMAQGSGGNFRDLHFQPGRFPFRAGQESRGFPRPGVAHFRPQFPLLLLRFPKRGGCEENFPGHPRRQGRRSTGGGSLRGLRHASPGPALRRERMDHAIHLGPLRTTPAACCGPSGRTREPIQSGTGPRPRE